MGIVHLTNGHHGLVCSRKQRHEDLQKRTEFVSEMIGLPICMYYGTSETVTPTSSSMVWAMLQGLQKLDGFDSAVSFHYEKDHLILPNRVWGEISLGGPDNIIVPFSHDSREDNSPFVSLYQWLEEYYSNNMGDDAFTAFLGEWSDAKKWHQFFRTRIRRAQDLLIKKSSALREEAGLHDARADAIKVALG